MRAFYKIILLLIILIVIVLFLTFNHIQNNNNYSEEYEAIPPIPEKKLSSITLYFIQNNKLANEIRTIDTSNPEYEEFVVLELIKGPQNELMKRTVPKDTRIISIETIDEICYVNLSKEYINNQIWEVEESSLIIWSLVNSLTELEYIEKVQILIEGEKITPINIEYSFEEPFEANRELIKNTKPLY